MTDEEKSRPSSGDTNTANSPVDWTAPAEHQRRNQHHHLPHLHRRQHQPHYWDPSEAQEWFKRRRSSGRVTRGQRRASLVLERIPTRGRRWWKFTLRPWHDDEEEDWWFASTAIPLLAATLGPLANVLSIAALVTSWRMCLVPGVSSAEAAQCIYNGPTDRLLTDIDGTPFADPRWCYYLNVASLVVGFVGNLFLLCNFTQRIRYIIALPVTIIMWYIATGILIGITVSMALYVPPTMPNQIYTQGFWYGVIAAAMYMICSMLLMVNMLGYFLGHYPQHFQLTDSQRTLILQTMLFFVWLAGGAIVFSTVEERWGEGLFNWDYVNALYFCDVTILTVGFGDVYVTSNVGRGLLFPYAVGGIIMLGLMVSSISKFAQEIGSKNVIQKHVEHSRARTVGRTVTTSLELERHETAVNQDHHPHISAPMNPTDRSRATTIKYADQQEVEPQYPLRRVTTLRSIASMVAKPTRKRKPKLILLREEKDRFDAMRKIQLNTNRFKKWYGLALSVVAFGIVWCGGAVVFWRCEHAVQGMTYFEALYFCYVSLLTIGYGDLAPKSNAGRPFFVFWSLIAVPTMTILVSHLGDTVVSKFKHGTFTLADFTVLPQKGVWRSIADKISRWRQRRAAKHRVEQGFQVGPDPNDDEPTRTIEQLAEDKATPHELAARLAKKIRQTADHLKSGHHKRYSYEEWVEFTQLIRFTRSSDGTIQDEDDLVEWDWIGVDSPMMAKGSEPEFVLDRLCESMQRYIKHAARATERKADGKPQNYHSHHGHNHHRPDRLAQIDSRSEEGIDPLEKV